MTWMTLVVDWWWSYAMTRVRARRTYTPSFELPSLSAFSPVKSF